MKNGFSLLEVIIAISILGTGIGGAIALTTQTISTGVFVQKQMIAAHLAQEGLEAIHNIRHTNWVEEAEDGVTLWDAGLTNGNSCVNADSPALLNAGTCGNANREERRLYLFSDANKTFYKHDALGVPTEYYRYINITSGTDSDGKPYKLVKSTVEWGTGGIIAEDKLYNWKEAPQ